MISITALSGLAYFSELLIDVNILLRLVPRPFTATVIAIEIPAAIGPYSMSNWSKPGRLSRPI